MKVLILLLSLLSPSIGWSHSPVPFEQACELLLSNEFGRTPDDSRQGMVSQNVPVTVEALLAAYPRGIFPWGTNMLGFGRWHRPPERGVLFLDEVDIGRSDRKYLRKAAEDPELSVTIDHDFLGVVEACATVERFRTEANGSKVPDGAWITEEFKNAYARLHVMGKAHSVEVWRGNRLVGGLYGVFIGGVFTGESMFHLEPDVNKLAFQTLIERLKAGGHKFIDTQIVVKDSLVEKWNARKVPRAEFEQLLTAAQQQNLRF